VIINDYDLALRLEEFDEAAKVSEVQIALPWTSACYFRSVNVKKGNAP
jgi:hypothetical protein